ncbi:hypothetical protein HK107_03090 [Parvularcula sp. ZS-1/3]|uniref:EF-hand domain-containing protein n=1 Tax=Parvularcula mediterranea TaxID=2732508 RepID=A0A7Y3RJU7_9PROT|nr:hypothetical protein [Parvularcula mediterranea]NNU15310.1 hypothetical protein [Parvularcula mediterranea]
MRKLLILPVLALGACASTGPSIGGVSFADMDTNADGKVTMEEFTGKSAVFDAVDANDDKTITMEEAAAYARARRLGGGDGEVRSTGSRL